MTESRLPNKVYHQFNFYIGVACFIGMFYAVDITLAGVLFAACIANIASAQGMANRDNLEYLNKKIEGSKDA